MHRENTFFPKPASRSGYLQGNQVPLLLSRAKPAVHARGWSGREQGFAHLGAARGDSRTGRQAEERSRRRPLVLSRFRSLVTRTDDDHSHPSLSLVWLFNSRTHCPSFARPGCSFVFSLFASLLQTIADHLQLAGDGGPPLSRGGDESGRDDIIGLPTLGVCFLHLRHDDCASR